MAYLWNVLCVAVAAGFLIIGGLLAFMVLAYLAEASPWIVVVLTGAGILYLVRDFLADREGARRGQA